MSLTEYYTSWIAFLETVEGVVGLPLVLGGVILMVTGWRLWQPVAFVTLALGGAYCGQLLSGSDATEWWWIGIGGLVTGSIVFILPDHSATAVGGLLGGGLGALVIGSFGVDPVFQIAVGAVTLLCCVAWCFVNRLRVVVIITAIEGGVLLLSGIKVLIAQWPMMQSFFRSMVNESPFMIGFFIFVMAVVGIATQQADANRSTCKAVRGA